MSTNNVCSTVHMMDIAVEMSSYVLSSNFTNAGRHLSIDATHVMGCIPQTFLPDDDFHILQMLDVCSDDV